jgi:serine O-acetyltransferase
MSIRKTVTRRLEPYHRVVVWGAGGMARNALKRWLPVKKVAAAVDSNPDKAGKFIDGVQVQSPDAIHGLEADCIVICTHAHAQVRAELKKANVSTPLFYIYELFLPAGGWAAMSPLQRLSVDVVATKNTAWPIFLLQKPQILVNCSFRSVQAARSFWLAYPLYPFLYVLHYLCCIVFSVQLPHDAQIGPGLIFAHYGTIVFTTRARIGAFFTIYHGCTIGTDVTGAGPVIDDYVTQFAGSHILGPCKLGKNVRVGANAVVLGLEAPEGSSVVGIPARVASART